MAFRLQPQSARKNRRLILGRYANANGKEVPSKKATNDLVRPTEEIIEEIKSGKTPLYSGARHFVDFMRSKGG